MYKAHKVRLEPNNKQATGLSRAAGTARFAYNWGLARWSAQYRRLLQHRKLTSAAAYAGQHLVGVHPAAACAGRVCVIHAVLQNLYKVAHATMSSDSCFAPTT